mgnify:CR=1 FL=1
MDNTTAPVVLQQGLSSMQVVQAIVQAEGNLRLAAERLRTQPQQLIQVLINESASAEILSQQLRVLTLLRMFDALEKLHVTFVAALPEMEPHVVARTYVQLGQQLATLTEPRATAADPMDLLMQLLPPNVKQALNDVLQQPVTSDISSVPSTTA